MSDDGDMAGFNQLFKEVYLEDIKRTVNTFANSGALRGSAGFAATVSTSIVDDAAYVPVGVAELERWRQPEKPKPLTRDARKTLFTTLIGDLSKHLLNQKMSGRELADRIEEELKAIQALPSQNQAQRQFPPVSAGCIAEGANFPGR